MTIKINDYILRVIRTQHRTEQCLTGRFRVGHNCFTCKSMNHWSVIYGKLCYKLMWRKYRQTNMFKVTVFKVSIHVRSEKSKTKLDILVLEVCRMFVTWTCILVTNLETLVWFFPSQCWFGCAVISVLQNTLGSTLGKESSTFEWEQRCEEWM